MGNIGFSDCDICSGTNVKISSDLPQKIYYKDFNGDLQFNSNIKLTVRKIDSNLVFYINERFVHIFEIDLLSGKNIETIKLNDFVQMKINIGKIE